LSAVETAPLPLAGIKVADISWIAAGPLTAMWLANYGATVVRVESAVRIDGMRSTPPMAEGKFGINRSGYWASCNSNKYGITLDMNLPRGKEVARRLAAWADVLVENFTPGAMKNWGLDYPTVSTYNPGIVMISVSMQGQTGPYATSRGFGPMLQGLAGFAHLTGWPDRPPSGFSIPYPDFCAPQIAALATIGALIERRRTGRGQYIDLSQFEAVIHLLGAVPLDYAVNGRVQRRVGNLVPGAWPNGVYPCAPSPDREEENWIAISVRNDADWRALVAEMGQPAWAAQYPTMLHRKRHAAAIDAHLAAWTATQEVYALQDRLQAAGVPAELVRDQRRLHEDPQLKHIGHFQPLPHCAIPNWIVDVPAPRLSRTPARMRKAAPCLGADNDFVYLNLLGYTQEEYDQLILEGVVQYWEGE
jgi:crotonobetainyl-CoA:carnitine CoA-transferase CaiB-like acyl-CoA transferase